MRKGIVRLDGVLVGTLEETEHATRFTYDASWLSSPDAVPVSLTMPPARGAIRVSRPASVLREFAP